MAKKNIWVAASFLMIFCLAAASLWFKTYKPGIDEYQASSRIYSPGLKIQKFDPCSVPSNIFPKNYKAVQKMKLNDETICSYAQSGTPEIGLISVTTSTTDPKGFSAVVKVCSKGINGTKLKVNNTDACFSAQNKINILYFDSFTISEITQKGVTPLSENQLINIGKYILEHS